MYFGAYTTTYKCTHFIAAMGAYGENALKHTHAHTKLKCRINDCWRKGEIPNCEFLITASVGTTPDVAMGGIWCPRV